MIFRNQKLQIFEPVLNRFQCLGACLGEINYLVNTTRIVENKAQKIEINGKRVFEKITIKFFLKFPAV